jgi:hypothetical protein
MLAYADDVRSGAINDPTFISFVYSAPVGCDPFDEATWRIANPDADDVRIADIRHLSEQAKRLPSTMPAFHAFCLNTPTATDERWLDAASWDACADTAQLTGPVFGGLDLSAGSADLTAVVCTPSAVSSAMPVPYRTSARTMTIAAGAFAKTLAAYAIARQNNILSVARDRDRDELGLPACAVVASHKPRHIQFKLNIAADDDRALKFGLDFLDPWHQPQRCLLTICECIMFIRLHERWRNTEQSAQLLGAEPATGQDLGILGRHADARPLRIIVED